MNEHFRIVIGETELKHLKARKIRTIKAHIPDEKDIPICNHEGVFQLRELSYLDLPYVLPCRDCFFQITKVKE